MRLKDIAKKLGVSKTTVDNDIKTVSYTHLDVYKRQDKYKVGNSNSIFRTLGASNHTDKDRQNEDFYATDPIDVYKRQTIYYHSFVLQY